MTKAEQIKQRERYIAERDRLYSEGARTADDLVKAARAKRSPLHSWFEWDDETCGIGFRLEQARELWRAGPIHVRTEDARDFRVNEYVRDPNKEGRDQGILAVRELSRGEAVKMLEHEIGHALAALRRLEGLARSVGLEDMIKTPRRKIHRRVQEIAGQVAAV